MENNVYDETGEEMEFSDSELDEFDDCTDNIMPNLQNDLITDPTTKIHSERTESVKPINNIENLLSSKLVNTDIGILADDVIVDDFNKGKHQKNSTNTKTVTDQHFAVVTIAANDHFAKKKDGKDDDYKNNDKANDDDRNDYADDDDDDDDDYYSDEAEDEVLIKLLEETNRIAESRLAARRQARAEAREIRLRELERQQKNLEHNALDMPVTPILESLSRTRLGTNGSSGECSITSHRSREDSIEGSNGSSYLGDTKQELKDAEERFRKAMIANAQLDNERASQNYQIQYLKDLLEESEESNVQLQRELKDKTRDLNGMKRNLDKINDEFKLVQGQLNERDALIREKGLVIVTVESDDGKDAKRTLITTDNAELLGSVQGSLDDRLKTFADEKQLLIKEIELLKSQVDECKVREYEYLNNDHYIQSQVEFEATKEASKIICDYKFRLKKAEQDIANLQAKLTRSEAQLMRYKNAAEAAEKAEAELKSERGKLQKENRDNAELLMELEASNNHLKARLDKLNKIKNALLKECS